MNRRITTITDARALISDWTDGYVTPITEAQCHRAARALVDHLGGYDQWTHEVVGTPDDDDFTGELVSRVEGFDLDAALGDA